MPTIFRLPCSTIDTSATSHGMYNSQWNHNHDVAKCLMRNTFRDCNKAHQFGAWALAICESSVIPYARGESLCDPAHGHSSVS